MEHFTEEPFEKETKTVTKTTHEDRYVVKNKKCMVIFAVVVCGIFALAFILNTIEGKISVLPALILLLLLLLLFCCCYTRITTTEEIVVDLDKNRLYYVVNTLKKAGEPTEYFDLDNIEKGYINYGSTCRKGATGNQYLSDVCLLMKDGTVKKLVSDIEDEDQLNEIRDFLNKYINMDQKYQMGEAFKENEGDTEEARQKLDELASRESSVAQGGRAGALRGKAKRGNKGGKDGNENDEENMDDYLETDGNKKNVRGRRKLIMPDADGNKMTIRYEEEENEP